MLLAAMALVGCRGRPARLNPEEAIARRQHEGLTRLLAKARQGPLVGFEHVLVVVDERLVQELLSAVLPVERVLGGRYRILLTRASVRFDDGFALVRLGGSASLAGHDEQAHAELDVAGDLGILELDPASGQLRGRVNVIAVDARRVDVMGLRASRQVEQLVEELGQQRLESFGELLSSLEIPVRIERELELPGVRAEAGLRIAAARIPLQAAIVDVVAFRGRLWVPIRVTTTKAGP